MTKLETYLKEVEQRLNAATEGPWEVNDYGGIDDVVPEIDPDPYPCYSPFCEVKDAWFIAHSRTDVEILLKMVKKLTSQRNNQMSISDGKMMTRGAYDSELESLIPDTEGGE